jgi:hypothetical protein
MTINYCDNCEQLIGNLEISFDYHGHIVCLKCKSILDKEAADMSTSSQYLLNEIPEVVERHSSLNKSYIRKHWCGELSLAVSFWINLFLLNVIIMVVWALLGYSEILKNPLIAARVVISYLIGIFAIVYPWQIIGLWRSSNRHIRFNGKHFWARTAQVLVVLGFIVTLSSITTNWPICESMFRIAFEIDEYKNPTLTLVKNDTFIHLQGYLNYGVSKKVSIILKNNPGIEGIILDSMGGWIYEGRELSKLIFSYDLNTYSIKGCYSAATIAFIAGKKRYLGVGANLAFHQYKMGYKSLVAFSDMKNEQANDMLIFRQQGVKEEFLKKLFDAAPDDLWYPTIDEMLNAGVIHGIINPSILLPMENASTFSVNDIENILLRYPVFNTIKKYEPNTYNKIKLSLSDQIEKGAESVEIQRSVADIIAPIGLAALSRTSDDALIQYAHIFIEIFKKLKEVDPIICMKAIYPEQYGSANYAKYLSVDDLNLMLEVMNKIIIDAYEKFNPPVDTKDAELLMEKLILMLGEDSNYIDLKDLHNKADYGRHCDVIIKFFEIINKEDRVSACNFLRYIFSSNKD